MKIKTFQADEFNSGIFCISFSGQHDPLEWVQPPFPFSIALLQIYDFADADARLIILCPKRI